MTRPAPGTLVVRTPEGVSFRLTLASPVVRFLAWLVDVGCVLVVGMVVTLLLGLLGVVHPDLAQALIVLAWFLIQMGYAVGFEWAWRGQTPGKRILGLRVMDAEGYRLGFNQVFMRNLLRFVDFLPAAYLVGGLATLCSRRSQRLGDLAANTVVVRHPKVLEPDWESLEAEKYNSLKRHAHAIAMARQRTPPDAARLALQALLRRRQLAPAARVELFREVADYFRGLVAWPADAVEGISDEQFVRNVVEVLFRSEIQDREQRS